MILVVNAGSSSIKVALFDADLTRILSATATEIGGASRLETGSDTEEIALPDHEAALDAILDRLARRGHTLSRLSAAAHRIVHGGDALTAPVRITPEIRAQIVACIPLAPLHNPHNLAAINALTRAAPDLPQIACFDTGFHATNPAVARAYALPDRPETRGLRRYGFHGISYAGLTRSLADLNGGTPPARLLALHLGNGASLCAIKGGQSVATTMGYSPLSGLTMGTRTGDIDGNAVLKLAEDLGIPAASRLLNKDSGLLGLGGASDMRALQAAGTDAARFAIDHFCYWAIRHAGSMIAAMGGLDAVAFTGGIGEHDSDCRARIAAGLAWAGVTLDSAANLRHAPDLGAPGASISVHIVPANEERTIAKAAHTLIA